MHLTYFRPGNSARLLARCQFGLASTGRGGLILTYPIKGCPWRRNPTRNYDVQLAIAETAELFADVGSITNAAPDACLCNDQLWSDMSEPTNAVTRDFATNAVCHTIWITKTDGSYLHYFAMREDSPALLESRLHASFKRLAAPYETLDSSNNGG